MSYSLPPMDRNSQTITDLNRLSSEPEHSDSEWEVHVVNTNNVPSSDTPQLHSSPPTTPETRRDQHVRAVRDQIARNRALIHRRNGRRSHSLPPTLPQPISSPEPHPNQENIPPYGYLLPAPLHKGTDFHLSLGKYPSSPNDSPPPVLDVVCFGRQVPRVPLAPLYHLTVVHDPFDSDTETDIDGDGSDYSGQSGSRGRKRYREEEIGLARKKAKYTHAELGQEELEGDTLVDIEDATEHVHFHDTSGKSKCMRLLPELSFAKIISARPQKQARTRVNTAKEMKESKFVPIHSNRVPT
jgi:hypothetical protein